MEKRWYVVQTYAGYENKVMTNLLKRIETMNMQDKIFRVLIPEEKEVTIKDGVRKEKLKKTFPGYVLVEMIDTDDSWYMVRNTPGVTGFLGSSGKGTRPVPLPTEEIMPILKEDGCYKCRSIIRYRSWTTSISCSWSILRTSWKNRINRQRTW